MEGEGGIVSGGGGRDCEWRGREGGVCGGVCYEGEGGLMKECVLYC